MAQEIGKHLHKTEKSGKKLWKNQPHSTRPQNDGKVYTGCPEIRGQYFSSLNRTKNSYKHVSENAF